MTLSELYHRDVPEYYDWMYLDGYTPEQIMYAKRKQMYRDYIERKNAKREAKESEPEFVIPNLTFKSVVRVK